MQVENSKLSLKKVMAQWRDDGSIETAAKDGIQKDW